MGAHSLGRASPFASGYSGFFTGSKTIMHFDERYYSQMIDAGHNWKNQVIVLEREVDVAQVAAHLTADLFDPPFKACRLHFAFFQLYI